MRIRTIKPEFFVHEELFDAEARAGLPLRVAFSGLWCAADREGRFQWRPRSLKLGILPYDDLDFEDVLHALEAAGFIRSYVVGGKKFAEIPSWHDHQSVNLREKSSRIPENPNSESTVVPVHDESSPYGQEQTRRVENRKHVDLCTAFASVNTVLI